METETKIGSLLWGPCDRSILTGHQTGTVMLWDAVSGATTQQAELHENSIQDMQASKDRYMMITASKDTSAKVRTGRLAGWLARACAVLNRAGRRRS